MADFLEVIEVDPNKNFAKAWRQALLEVAAYHRKTGEGVAITPAAQVVGFALGQWIDGRDKCGYRSVSNLEADTGLSDKTVKPALKVLEAAGLIKEADKQKAKASSFGGGRRGRPPRTWEFTIPDLANLGKRGSPNNLGKRTSPNKNELGEKQGSNLGKRTSPQTESNSKCAGANTRPAHNYRTSVINTDGEINNSEELNLIDTDATEELSGGRAAQPPAPALPDGSGQGDNLASGHELTSAPDGVSSGSEPDLAPAPEPEPSPKPAPEPSPMTVDHAEAQLSLCIDDEALAHEIMRNSIMGFSGWDDGAADVGAEILSALVDDDRITWTSARRHVSAIVVANGGDRDRAMDRLDAALGRLDAKANYETAVNDLAQIVGDPEQAAEIAADVVDGFLGRDRRIAEKAVRAVNALVVGGVPWADVAPTITAIGRAGGRGEFVGRSLALDFKTHLERFEAGLNQLPERRTTNV